MGCLFQKPKIILGVLVTFIFAVTKHLIKRYLKRKVHLGSRFEGCSPPWREMHEWWQGVLLTWDCVPRTFTSSCLSGTESREWTGSRTWLSNLKQHSQYPLSPVRLHLLKIPEPSETALPIGKQVFKLAEAFHSNHGSSQNWKHCRGFSFTHAGDLQAHRTGPWDIILGFTLLLSSCPSISVVIFYSAWVRTASSYPRNQGIG